MNGATKFHKPTGPAFNAGERWVSTCGNLVEIVSVTKYGEAMDDYDVRYNQLANNVECTKGAWNFQVRYEHVADKNIRKKSL